MEEETLDLTPLQKIIDEYKTQPGAVVPVLQKAQGIYGWLPREVMEAIAQGLNMPLSRIYGVATFYSQFYLEPRGKHVLHLCNGTACHVKGAPALAAAITDEFGINPGETTADGEFTMEIVYCLGSCALAPVAVLDGQVMGGVRRDPLLKRVRKCIESGKQASEAKWC